jgi:secreted trypsin-like serine protease
LTETGLIPDIAQKLEIPIFDYHNCTRNIENPSFRSFMASRTFCGGPGDGRGVCEGDSGSGVYVKYNGQYYLRGSVSTSMPGTVRQCNVNTQALFMDVTQFYDWIKRTIS